MNNSNASSPCPDDYTSLTAREYNWPGNYKGCGCKGADGNYTFYKDSCPDLKDCKKLDETDEKMLYKWRDSLICY